MGTATTAKLTTDDGVALHVTDWLCPVPAERGLLILHGIGEHSGRYAHVAAFLNACGLDVRSYDHRGHGRSGGARGDVPDDEALVRDAALVMRDFAARFDAPPLLLGHSMGGLFAARFAADGAAPIGGLILSSPALAIRLSGVQRLLLQLMSVLAPGVGVTNGLPERYLSHDAAVVDAYRADPLVHAKITARLLRSMLAAITFAHARAAQLTVPTLLLVAGADRLVDPSGSAAFHARLQPGVGTLLRYPALYHEIFNELDKDQVFADLHGWLQAQGFTPARAPLSA